MIQIVLVLGIYVSLYNLFLISSSEPLIGEGVRHALDDEFPYVVSVGMKHPNTTGPYGHMCTGVLVSNRDILSAEHCFRNKRKEDVRIFMGNKDLELAKDALVLWWYTYDNWAEKNKIPKHFTKNDMVIIRLAKNVTKIEPGILSTLKNREFVDQEVAIIGWGRKDDNSRAKFLQIGILRVVHLADCRNRIRNRTQLYIDNNFFCTFVQPYLLASQGDSGGPVLYYNEVVGITKSICPHPGIPSEQINVHTGIYNYRNFVYDVIANGKNAKRKRRDN